MKFVNRSRNTIYLSDLGRYVPYHEDGATQAISTDDLKKSVMFQQLVLSRRVEVLEAGESRLERNLLAKLEAQPAPKEDVPEPVPSKDALEVKIRGHFYDYSGYGKVNRNLLYALARAGVRVQAIPLKSVNELGEWEVALLKKFERRVGDGAILIDSVIPSFADDLPDEPCLRRILYTTVEAHGVPRQFVEAADRYDEVWVPSEFCRRVLVSGGTKAPVSVVPNSVDTRFYSEAVKPYELYPFPKPCIFLSVFNWHPRKAPDVLLRAYVEEFTNRDDTTLLLMTRDSSGSNDLDKEIAGMVDKYKGRRTPPQIMRCARTIPESEMGRLYRVCTCFVLPSRGEGFGLPYVEASLCGLPVIGTITSGQADFLTEDNSLSIPVGRATPMPWGTMKVHYWEGQPFADLDDDFVGELRRKMRAVYNNFPAAFKRNRELMRTVAGRYSTEVVGEMARVKLQTIWEGSKCLSA